MRYHFFLHYGWFFQNLGKEGRWTFMHTTVCKKTNYFFAKLTSCTSGFCGQFCVHHLGKLTLLKIHLYQILSENSKIEIALMQAWSTAQEQSVKKCIKLLSICQDTSIQTFPIYSSYHSFVDVVTFSANQKSVKPSKIAIFQVQMQSKN